jgi:hypothetical protein
MLQDNWDHDIPFGQDDDWIECSLDYPSYGDPSEWPAWTDETRYEPTPEDLEDYKQG